jgi:hypothetical protein
MPARRLPVRPDLEQLQRQAKEFLRAIQAGDADAIAEFREHRSESIDPAAVNLAAAQHVLARSYGVSSWTRLAHGVRLAEAIWRDDADTVGALVASNPALIHEHVLIRTDSGWGPPMTYAANLGRDRIIRLLYQHGAKDLESAAGRAALQGKADTVRMIWELAGRPSPESVGWVWPVRPTRSVSKERPSCSRSASAPTVLTGWTRTRSNTFSGATAATRRPNIAFSSCGSSMASNLPTRP